MRYLVALALLVSLLLSSIAASSAATASGKAHGCAWPVPPGLHGSPAPAVPGIIVLNEVLLAPNSTWNCSESPPTHSIFYDSWLELYNTQNQPYNLYETHTEIDSGPNTNAYTLPLAAAIAAHGYLVLFPRIDPYFVSTETSTLRLIISGTVVDQVTVPKLGLDQSYARTSDGGPSWQVTSTPTIDASNSSLQVTPTPTSPPGGRGGGSGTSTGTNYKTLVSGTQPQWHNLQLPTMMPTSSINALPTTVPAASPSSSNQFGLLQRIALTILLTALAVTLFWCWRVYSKT